LRFFDRCFVFIFLLMMTLPLVFIDLSSGDRVSVRENRMLAEFPKWTDLKHHQVKFIRGFEDWFQDSTGFREQFLALYNVIGKNRRLNGVSYRNGQYVYLFGEQGHSFFAYTDGFLISKFQGKQFIPDENLSNMAGKLESVKTYLDRKGIPFIVMFCADKESIYPEYYPKSIIWGQEPIQLDVITNYIKEHTSVDVFNIRQALMAQKDNYLLYPVSSGDLSHYTEIGAFFAYRELMKHINVYFPEITPFEIDDIEISNNNTPLTVSMKAEKTYKELDLSFFDNIDLIRPFTWENIIFENTKPDLPVILFFRDSFANEHFFGKYIAQQFGRTILIHYFNIEHFEEIIDKYNPDIVVFESAEGTLNIFTDCVNRIPKL
jgi:alginate O-acetyltransferase complex protein AlgJ